MSQRRRTILVVDDDRLFCDTLVEFMSEMGHDVVAADTGAAALRLCGQHPIDIVLLDQRLPDAEGAALCPEILKTNEDIKIIFVTAYPSYDNAVSGIRGGAFDYLAKPINPSELELVLARAVRTLELEQVAALRTFEQERDIEGAVLVGHDRGLAEVWAQVKAAAAVVAPVLVTGETGTGKNLVARSIHYRGPLRRAPFVTINCAALPESLIETELFGHERGAFTGAHAPRKGIFEMAAGGTLLLDEIGDMPSHLQAKLLGVLDSKQIRRVGSDKIRSVDTRVIASTSVDLEDAVARKAFREDLYYRLSVVRIHIPPLRQRRQDIPALCRHCVAELAQGRRVSLSEAELDRLADHSWPGNVRELRNVLERAIILGSGEAIEPSSLIRHRSDSPDAELTTGPTSVGDDPAMTLADLERAHIERTLQRCGGHRAHTARALGISLSTLKRRLRDLRIHD